MAGYYSVLAAGISKQGGCTPRWVNCKTQCSPSLRILLTRDVSADVASSTGTEILSGCLPVFKSGSGTETTCESPAAGPVKELLGVTCIDLNIIVEISTLRDMSCWDAFWADVVSETEACATVSLTQSELETLRGAVSSDSVCGNMHRDPPVSASVSYDLDRSDCVSYEPGQQSGARALSASVALAAAAVAFV